MRKFFTILILVAFMCAASLSALSAEINPDKEIHRVIGGLYALSAVTAMNGEINPAMNKVLKYFSDVPVNWQNNVRFERVKNEVWVGISVEKYTTARHYLRSNAPELGITDTPAGNSWLGGDYAWIKAASVVNGKLRPSKLVAARGSGMDYGAIFFAAGKDFWWEAYPAFTKKAAQEVLKRWGVEQTGLHKPEGVSQSIYDSVKPSEVQKPDDIHTKRKKNFVESFDMDMGDVIFRPIPNTNRIR